MSGCRPNSPSTLARSSQQRHSLGRHLHLPPATGGGWGRSRAKESGGSPVPPQQLLPFYLAARSNVNPGKDLLGEALCSSYEAFRSTRQNRDPEKDEQDESATPQADLSHASWYLGEFDLALARCSGSTHPKIHATIRTVVDLWEAGEKVLVFAFYRRTCRALRIHISNEIERRIMSAGQRGFESRPRKREQRDRKSVGAHPEALLR